MTLKEIAGQITVYLKKFEADPAINTVYGKAMSTHKYWHAFASSSGRYVYVQYIGYQGNSHLTKEQALKYLAWLQAGGVGKHYTALEAK